MLPDKRKVGEAWLTLRESAAARKRFRQRLHAEIQRVGGRRALARKVGVSRQTIYNLHCDRRDAAPSEDTLAKLCVYGPRREQRRPEYWAGK